MTSSFIFLLALLGIFWDLTQSPIEAFNIRGLKKVKRSASSPGKMLSSLQNEMKGIKNATNGVGKGIRSVHKIAAEVRQDITNLRSEFQSFVQNNDFSAL